MLVVSYWVQLDSILHTTRLSGQIIISVITGIVLERSTVNFIQEFDTSSISIHFFVIFWSYLYKILNIQLLHTQVLLLLQKEVSSLPFQHLTKSTLKNTKLANFQQPAKYLASACLILSQKLSRYIVPSGCLFWEWFVPNWVHIKVILLFKTRNCSVCECSILYASKTC